MENDQELTFWKNYQTALQWIQGNSSTIIPPVSHCPVEPMIEDDEDEDDEDEFAIDDELLEFYRHTQDHRANRKIRKKKEKAEAEQIELIPGEQMRPNLQTISKLPPVNQAKLRQLKYDWLYGSTESANIHQRETALQMRFDQLFDQKRPAYFPSLPNRLSLEPFQQGDKTASRYPPLPIEYID